MPSPIAHSITGYAIARLFPADQRTNRQAKQTIFALFYGILVALAPDLDFIPQLLTGVRYHHGFSHSLMVAVGFSIVIWIVSYFLARQSARWLFLLTLMSYSSHLLLDFFTDGGPGIQLLWPFVKEHFRSPLALFPSTHHSLPLIHPTHLIFIGFELSYSFILLGVIWKRPQHPS